MDAVLFVDDEPDLLTAYRRFLGTGYAVETAPSGEVALAALARRPFAVVVTDFQMPGMDGVRLLATVRERYPDVVRLLITGHGDLGTAIESVNSGQVFRFLTKPFDPAGLVAAVDAARGHHRSVAAERERTERALWESEERYRQLFDANPRPLWVYDADTLRFLAVNEAAVREYGYTRAEFLRMTPRVIEADPPGAADLPTAGDPGGRVCRHRYASGEERRVEVATRPIEFGGRPAWLVSAADVTERTRLECQLKQAQKLEAIGQLAAGIGHEINTPVQYIGDNTNFLADAFRDVGGVLALYRAAGDDPGRRAAADRAAAESDLDYLLEEVPRAVAQTLDGVGHVARIVRAMKEFAHPGRDEKIPVDLNRAVETVATVSRNEWKYAAEVGYDLAPDLPPVPGLPGELNQVFLNLLVNAAHAIRAAGGGDGERGKIILSTRASGGAVEVRVADTGCGIPEAIRDRLFDPFFTTKPVGQGTGQGLAIAHAVVVQRHGGSIRFESQEGRGTTFIVRLPATDGRVPSSQSAETSAGSGSAAFAAGGAV